MLSRAAALKGAAACVVFVLLISSVCPPPAARAQSDPPAGPQPAYAAVLVKDLMAMEPTTEFDCLNRVYIYITWYHVPGRHRVTALWFNPQGKQQDAHDLDFEGGKEVACWLALEFLNIQDERNPMLVNTAAARFHGQWQVKLFLDGKKLETQTFLVSCG